MNVISWMFRTFVCTACFWGACGMQPNDGIMDLLPESPPGWRIEGESKIYTRDNLYEYIDGGAELFLSFGFERMTSRIYVRDDQPDILLDIFDMGSSESAFGVFSHSRERLETEYGQGSQSSPGLILFWKDRYYVSLLANPETPESRRALDWIARRIENTIPKTGPLPDILDMLPREGLIESSIRTFAHHAWINTYYFISEENLLDIGPQNKAVLAKYDPDHEKMLLLVVSYTDETDARNACVAFRAAFFPEADEDGALRIEDGTWSAVRCAGNHAAVVFQGGTREAVLALLDRFEKQLHETELKEGERS